MNLQEDINRIKQVMGINENRNLFFIRRQHEFLEDVLNSFDWAEVQESNTFEEYVEDILRHALDAFFGYNNILVTNEEIAELLPIALQILRSKERLYNQIKGYWNRQLDSRIDESDYALPIKRRLGRLNNDIRSQYSDLAASRFDNFDHFLRRVVHDTTRHIAMDFFDSEDFDDMSKMMDDFEPKMLNYIKTNKEIYDDIHNYFFSEGGWGDPESSSFEKVNRLNESKEMLFIKRRMHILDDYIEHAYDWLSPRAFDDFDHFLKRVVFSATRDFVHDELGGEYQDQLKLRDKLEPQIFEYIKNNEGIYNDIYDHYISNIG
jgi:hypothetical protein